MAATSADPLVLHDFTGQVGAAAISSSKEGLLIAYAANDNTVKVVHAATGGLRAELDHANAVACTFSSKGSFLATSSSDGKLKMWRCDRFNSSTPHFEVESARPGLPRFAIAPDESRAVVRRGTTLWLFDMGRGERQAEAKLPPLAKTSGPCHFFFYHDSQRFAGVCTSNQARNQPLLLEYECAETLRFLRQHDFPGRRLVDAQVSPDGSFVSINTGASCVLWDLASAAVVRNFDVGDSSDGAFKSCSFARNGLHVATTTQAGDVAQVWSISTGSCVTAVTLPARKGQCALSPDAKVLATTSNKGSVHLWSVPDGRLIRKLPPPQVIEAVEFSVSGNRLLGLSRNRLFLWPVHIDVEPQPTEVNDANIDEARKEATFKIRRVSTAQQATDLSLAEPVAAAAAQLTEAQKTRLDDASRARESLVATVISAQGLLLQSHAAVADEKKRQDELSYCDLAERLGIAEASPGSIPEDWHFDRRQMAAQKLLDHNEQHRARLERRRQDELAALRLDQRLVEEEYNEALAAVDLRFQATITEHERQLQALRTAHEREQAAMRRFRDQQAAAFQKRLTEHEQRWQQQLQASRESAQLAREAVETLRTEEIAWKARVATGQLQTLLLHDVDQLLVLWGFDVPRSSLKQFGVDGFALEDLPEADMEEALQLKRLGDRRRLSILLTRLKHGLGIDPVQHEPGTLCWSVDEVAQWLRELELEAAVDHFRDHNITGEVLLELTRDDMSSLGIANLGDRARIAKAISQLRKQVQTGQQADGVAQATNAAAAMAATRTQREVLELVLEENEELKDKLEQARQQFQTARRVPHEFRCPITMEVMLDPVMAADGHTYERDAIEGWFQINRTSPLTNQAVPNFLVPNHALKKLISSFFEQPGVDRE